MTFQEIKALTWDHPRGFNALDAASKSAEVTASGLKIHWDKQPLEGFESHPIADLCSRYDLVVLDHPHVGEALVHDCLVPLEEVFSQDVISNMAAGSIGPSLSSYHMAGRHWALPLDAATQVMAIRSDLLDYSVPLTWDEVRRVSEATGKVALSLAGPHAFVSYLAIATALGEPPSELDPAVLVSQKVGEAAFEIMADLQSRSPIAVRPFNPIGILGHMAANDDVLLCPLIYGYVNYADPSASKPITFQNAPRAAIGGRPGSTLGGTGIGISRRCDITPALKQHLLWLMADDAQTRFIPFHDGQPSLRSAWHDDSVNERWSNFYSNTAETLESAYVRPRHNGYIPFQSEGSAILRHAFDEGTSAGKAVADIQAAYLASRI